MKAPFRSSLLLAAAALLLIGCRVSSDFATEAASKGPESAGHERASTGETRPAAAPEDGEQMCGEGQAECEGECVNVDGSDAHCGKCGRRCFASQSCDEGVCRGLGVLTVPDLSQALAAKDFLLINVRAPAFGVIPGTDATIPHDRIEEIKGLIGPDLDRRVVLYCGTANRVHTPLRALTAAGYRSISFLDGGITAWQRAGLPLEG